MKDDEQINELHEISLVASTCKMYLVSRNSNYMPVNILSIMQPVEAKNNIEERRMEEGVMTTRC